MSGLNTLFVGQQLIELEEINSTSNYAAELLKAGQMAEGTVIMAHSQTQGRGQRGNTWESSKGQSLTFSLILYPKFLKISEQFYLSEAIAMAVIDSLKELNINAQIKWPNDIYVGDKKLGGILIENSINGNSLSTSIIGIGLNINQTNFPENLPNPTSLKLLTNKEFNIRNFLEHLLGFIEKRFLQLRSLQFRELKKEYLASLYRMDGYHSFQLKENKISARIKDVLPDGRLELTDSEEKTFIVNFQEIRFL